MKKLIASILLAAMLIASLAGCASNTPAPETTAPPTQAPVETEPAVDNTLADAAAYVKTIYKNVTESTPADFERIASVPVGDVKYDVVWSVNVSEDLVKVVPGADKVIIDVNEESTEEVAYVLTATLTGTDGKQESLSWNHVLPASLGTDMGAIVDMAYTLADGQKLDAEATLTGVITSIDTAWSADYQNITVTIAVAGREDKPIMCYRLKGEGADSITIGDTITVTGYLKNYKGTIEFDAGCLLEAVVKGEGVQAPTDPAEIVEAAYALEDGKSLPYTATLTGKIYGIKQMYSPFYDNITVQMYVEGKSITCYRMKGEGLDTLNINDVITVAGNLKNYRGTIEFDTGCMLVSQEHYDPYEDPETFAEVLEDAKKVPNKNYLHYSTTRVGVITSKPSYNEKYNSYTFWAEIEGHTVQCYSMEYYYEGQPEKGDTIQIVGHMTAYNGVPQFDYCSILYILAKGEPEPEIVVPATFAEMYEQAKNLGDNELLPYETVQTGVVTEINTPYSDKYGNISFTMDVGGTSVYCYRQKGAGVETMAVGDSVTVAGALTAYKGVPQFGSGSAVTAVVKASAPETEAPETEAPEETTPPATEAPTEPETPALTTPAEIMTAAYALAEGEALEGTYTLSGVITSVDTAYSDKYQNITVTIAVDGAESKSIQCFRLKGEGADVINAGQRITVSGVIKNYKGTVEFDAGCILVSYEKPPMSSEAILKAAYELADGESLEGTYTLTGVITSVDTAYSDKYQNVTVTMVVPGCESMPIQCFRLKGEGADKIAVGDTISVSGVIKNYKGTVEFDAGCVLGGYSKA